MVESVDTKTGTYQEPTVFIEKHSRVSEPVWLEPKLFKGPLYYYYLTPFPKLLQTRKWRLREVK